MVRRAEAAAVVKKFLFILAISFFYSSVSFAQDIPSDELQARINTYFDNFGVIVIYPSIDYTKKLSDNTSVSARYLTDIISAASMKSHFNVDGVTSATSRTEGGADNTPDEWRHEFGLGVTQRLGEGIVSLNGLYSIEHDYSSRSGFISLTYPFANKNTYLTLGGSVSLDKVFPQTRTWTKDENTYSFNVAFSQILSKNIITQIDASYIDVNGYQQDGYQIVQIYNDKQGAFINYEPVLPDRRIRRAVGIRTNIGITDKITFQPGYRYYWDTWNINSNTFYGILSKNFSDIFSASLEYRQYFQTKAFFFQPYYLQPEEYMSVEGNQNSGYSNEINIKGTLKGKKDNFFLTNENIQLLSSIGFYKRHYDSPDWHSGYLNLYSFLFSLGIRYHL